MKDDQRFMPENLSESAAPAVPKSDAITCPVCGAVAVQEKCKVICRSEKCRGRVVYNCSEF